MLPVVGGVVDLPEFLLVVERIVPLPVLGQVEAETHRVVAAYPVGRDGAAGALAAGGRIGEGGGRAAGEGTGLGVVRPVLPLQQYGGARADEGGDGDDGTYIVGEDGKNPGDGGDSGDGENGEGGARAGDAESGEKHSSGKNTAQGGAPGAYAPKGTAAPAAAAAPVAKDGKALTLRFVLPSGPGSEALRTVAGRVSDMLDEIGIDTAITKVPDESYFKDHIASGEYDLALYSWPATAFPATDARPVYAKPVPAADGSLNVAQNYTRVGTDQVDQLFDRAMATLDRKEARDLLRKADSRIWAAAGSVPLYQRPQLTAARKDLANAGAFGFETPVYEDMGFLKKGARGPRPAASPSS